MSKLGIPWGCVADDFTGASDVASFWSNEGMRVVLVNGIPAYDKSRLDGCDGVVIALKTRTIPAKQAVSETLLACRWLKEAGVDRLFIKYCSTFDSTPQGNIGPVLDRIMETYGLDYTILCPALPVNGRQVRNGILYVDGVPLSESPMRNHPLTPMWDSRLKHLIEAQSKYPALEIHGDRMMLPEKELKAELSVLAAAHGHCYAIPDFYEEAHAGRIVELFGNLPVLSGGSGLMTALAKSCLAGKPADAGRGRDFPDGTAGGAVLLAGSCSSATLAQISDYKAKGNPFVRIDPQEWMAGRQTLESVLDFILAHPGASVLVYSSAPPDQVLGAGSASQPQVSESLEQAMADIAQRALLAGKTRIIVAGGETSGAVTKRLGFHSFALGSSIAPGVPVMIPLENPAIRLVLKSGNFGQTNFFTRALKKTAAEQEGF